MKKIFLITINYNSEKETHKCLASLKKIKKKDFELQIIIVDNASSKPFELLSSESKDIFLIRNERNLGFTGGNNLGIKYALSKMADYILLLNNDTYVDSKFLINLLEIFDKNQKVGAVVPKIYFANGHEYHKDRYKSTEIGKVFWYAGGEIDWKNVFSFHRGVDAVDLGQYDLEEAVSFATGCCILIKSEVFKKIGFFDDNYFLYFEDADLSKRMQDAGYQIIYSPKSVIWHISAASSDGSGASLHDYFLTRNRMIFGLKYASVRTKIALLRESIKLLFFGRQWQKQGIIDFYRRSFGKGSYGQ